MAETVFSTQLKKLRKERGVKQEELAEHLGVSAQAVSKWENGSYPDGDLLPKIAKFFQVSIDYLYGDERENKRFDQRVAEYMSEKGEDGFAESLLELLWMATNWGMEEEFYIPLPRIEKNDGQMGSCHIRKNGDALFLRLTEDMRYAFFMEYPKEGGEEYLTETKKLSEVFRLLGEEDALKIFLFMLTLKPDECIRAETVADYLHIPVETVERVLQTACSFYDYNTMVNSINLLAENERRENLYSISYQNILVFLRLIITAKDVLHPLQGFRNLNINREVPLLDREKLLKLWKTENF